MANSIGGAAIAARSPPPDGVLTSIHIRNLAVVAVVDLEFDAGFSVLTGETGAGKSILVDALALALGARAEGRLVRRGAARAEVSVVFERSRLPAAACDWLREQQLDSDEECVVRRTLTPEGRSRGFINGQPATMQSLREFGELLVDICGQQAYLGLRHASAQRELLDQFGGHSELVATVQTRFEEWRQCRDALAAIDLDHSEREQRAELLGFQCRELEALDLAPGEYPELEATHRRLAASQRIEAGLTEVLNLLYEAEQASAQDIVARCEQELTGLADSDADIAPAAEMLGSASVLIGEAAAAVRARLQAVEHDPELEAQVGQRIADARELARKHRVTPAELPELRQRLARELADLRGGEGQRERLEEQLAARADELRAAAAELSQARQSAAPALSAEVTARMRELGMPDGNFEVLLRPVDGPEPGCHGAETLAFSVAVNAGQPAGPMAKVASGGELSRLSLALQVAAMGPSRAGTLVFDEVDAGVGGRVAELVGQLLRALGQQAQVLCVTHLPQVASQAGNHFRVAKHTRDGVTTTAVDALAGAERVEELARMLGGLKITKRTLDHAREMLAAADIRKAS